MTTNDLHRIGRRSVLLGALAAGTATWAIHGRTTASAAELDYDGPAAFDVAEQAYFDQGANDNEGGGFAWGGSYYLLGLLRMYQAHHDTDYLDRFSDYAGTVLAKTDKARGVQDYAGRSGEVWRTAGDYTAAHATVRTADGTDAVQLRWAGTKGSQTTARITAVSGNRFTITLANPGTSELTLSDVSLDPGDDHYLVDEVNAAYTTSARWTAVELRSEPAAAPVDTTATFASQYYVFAVHTGMISYPLAKFARIVLASDELSDGPLGERATELLAAAKNAVAFHDHEYHGDVDDGGAAYVFDRGAPIPFDGTIQPYNQSHAMGQTLAELYRATGEQCYRSKVEELLASYEKGLAADGDAYSWHYWPAASPLYQGYSAEDDVSDYTPSFTPAQQYEDISHASISVEFVYTAAEAGIKAAQEQLTRFAATYQEHVVRSDDDVWYRVDGSGDAVPSNAVQCARWGAYASQDIEIYQQALRVWDAAALTPDQGSHALAIAYLNWGRLEGWK